MLRTLPLVCLTALIGTAACDALVPLPVTQDRRPGLLSAIRLTPPVQLVTEGDTVAFQVELHDQDGRPFEVLPPWMPLVESSDTSVLRLSGRLAIAVGPGRALITAAAAGQTRQTELKVNPRALQLGIAGAYLNQVIQRLPDPHGVPRLREAIPLVAGREALLRVFVTGEPVNFFAPAVQVDLFHDGELTETLILPALREGVPAEADEGSLQRSWNVRIPAEHVRPGLAIAVRADPGGDIARAPGSVDRHPADGELARIDVRNAPPLLIRFVPIHHSGGDGRVQHPTFGNTGNVTPQNAHEFLETTRQIFPVTDVEVDVRDVYTTSALTEEGYPDWIEIIRELRLLWMAEEGGARHYYGVIHRGGGRGYLGVPVATGSDSEGTKAITAAHELGHNFNRLHSPCGNPRGVDASYPYPGGGIGHWGWNAATGDLLSPRTTDIMGYCIYKSPPWASDYTYEAVLRFREWAAARASAAARAAGGPVLIVWGGVRDDAVVIHPALTLPAAAHTDEDREGPYEVEGLDGDGRVLFSRSFSGVEVPHGDAGERHFVLAVPLAEAQPDRLSALRVRARGRTETLRSTGGAREQRHELLARGPAQVQSQRAGSDRVRVRWDAERFPLAVIRDAASGQILSFARGGDVTVRTAARQLDVALSDGTRMAQRRLEVEER